MKNNLPRQYIICASVGSSATPKYAERFIDHSEISHLTFNRHQSELSFKVVADRAEKMSVIVSTNLKFSEWTTLFERGCK
ncbi:ATP-binding protein [Alkaliphilus metalliredigens]|uniref:ATP-binding protein n=1 Tax=Alkaliphilus metalliredigens TaxID=208226 RepID=UPI000A05E2DB|nr:ATP-binding protein [Alkaliphilus metalliredigens]